MKYPTRCESSNFRDSAGLKSRHQTADESKGNYTGVFKSIVNGITHC